MSERAQSPSTYRIVLVVLLVLTVVTVGVSFLSLAAAGHVAAGLVVAVIKATLVVLFFMHALNSPRLTWVVIAAAVFWLGILVVLTLADYTTRGLVPYTPGH